MSLTTFLAGHGEWNPENGFTQVPKGCSVTFYTHHAKTVLTDAAYEVVAGTYASQPESRIEQYMQVPNMTQVGFVGAEVHIRNNFQNSFAQNNDPNTRILLLPAGARASLKQLFEALDGQIRAAVDQFGGIDFHWCCCRYVLMKGEIRGTAGFNATEDLLNDRYIFRDRVTNTIIGVHAK